MGCILAELLQRKPLFPGKDYIDQLKLIIKTLGSPSDSDLSFINSQKAQQYIKALPKAQVRSLLCQFGCGANLELWLKISHNFVRPQVQCRQCVVLFPVASESADRN